MGSFTPASRFSRLRRSQLHGPVKAENLHVRFTGFTNDDVFAGHHLHASFTHYTRPHYTFPPLFIRGGNVWGGLHGRPLMTPVNAPLVSAPPRGNGVFPAWFAIHATGWMCAHPHAPDDAIEELGHPAHLVHSYALAHLHKHHPGWMLPCTRCGKPQWNAENRPTCFDCRR